MRVAVTLPPKSLDQWALEVHHNAVSKGFYHDTDMTKFYPQATKIALIHSEATEVLEALRKSKGPEAIVDEISDILIRTLDLYQALFDAGVIDDSLDEAMEKKAAHNKTRPHMHGVRG
jgi:NTP pyrophosphatase (non-canonical NTP hydrolase)